MLTSVLLLMAQAGSPASAAVSTDEIVVLGQRMEERLAACIERSCPPAEEIELSLQLSVNQFAEGRYRDARGTLRRAIRRNRDHAAELPELVSSLYATLATVAEHEGNPVLWRASSRNNVEVLRRHLGESHAATLQQELSFGDNMAVLGTPDVAAGIYRAVQRKAAESGNAQLAAGAAFRRAWLEMMLGHDRDADHLADEAVALAGADSRSMAEMREILRTRIAVRRGEEGAIDALAARLRQSATKAPSLLFAPDYADITPDLTLARTRAWIDRDIRFADVGYWIQPDGRTAGAEILRDGGLGQWAPGILRQISGRRYIPLDLESGHPGMYRIERFTVRGTKEVTAGSRIPQRNGNLTIHVVDLTETDAMNEAHLRRMQDEPASSAR